MSCAVSFTAIYVRSMQRDVVALATTTPEQILRDELVKRQIRNASYSISAFARDLGVSQPYTSLVLAGKRKIPFKRALEFSAALRLTEAETTRFLQAVAMQSSRSSAAALWPQPSETFTQLDVEVDRFKLISQWYHLPILDLTTVKGFKANAEWVATKLGITAMQVRDAVDRLERLGLLEVKAGKWLKTNVHIAVPTSRSESAIRSFHEQMIEKAREELKSTELADFNAREIAGTTMAIDLAKLPEIKKRIQKFRKELAAFASEGTSTGLYQLNVQFFSLIKRGKK